jgi:hypothetical protein
MVLSSDRDVTIRPALGTQVRLDVRAQLAAVAGRRRRGGAQLAEAGDEARRPRPARPIPQRGSAIVDAVTHGGRPRTGARQSPRRSSASVTGASGRPRPDDTQLFSACAQAVTPACRSVTHRPRRWSSCATRNATGLGAARRRAGPPVPARPPAPAPRRRRRRRRVGLPAHQQLLAGKARDHLGPVLRHHPSSSIRAPPRPLRVGQ